MKLKPGDVVVLRSGGWVSKLDFCSRMMSTESTIWHDEPDSPMLVVSLMNEDHLEESECEVMLSDGNFGWTWESSLDPALE